MRIQQHVPAFSFAPPIPIGTLPILAKPTALLSEPTTSPAPAPQCVPTAPGVTTTSV